jgi:hypothetical protein
MSRFELLGGVGIMGFLSPMDTRDTYPVIDPVYGIDGLRNVPSIADLNAIPEPRRRSGMIVGVNGGEKYFKLKRISWEYNLNDWIELDLTKTFYVDKESPSGVIDGINDVFELSSEPIPNSEHLYVNGLLQDSGPEGDYIIDGKTIIFLNPPYIGMKIKCSYRSV